MSQERKTLVFDFFGVICSEVAPQWLEGHFPPERAAAVKHEVVGAADRGALSAVQMFECLALATGVPGHIVEKEWRAAACLNDEVTSFVRGFAGTRKIGLLTNAPADFFWPIFDSSGLDGVFDAIIVSSEIGSVKPDRRPYEVILDRLGVDATDAVMIDDNPLNVAAAAEVGMSSILFVDLPDLRRRLEGL